MKTANIAGMVMLILAISLAKVHGKESLPDDLRKPFEPDKHTVVLYHFDEGEGDETHDACGDPALTLQAEEKALWGSRPGFGATARFERQDANILVGPANNDKLELRTCTEEWTIEAWVRYTGPGGKDRWTTESGRRAIPGYTHGHICGPDEEGFSLPTGMRQGWRFYIRSIGISETREDGLMPGARFMGSLRGKDPNHDTSGILWPGTSHGWLDEDRGRFRDIDWHHVAWQFRYRDQTNFLFVDGKLIRQVQLPVPGHASTRIIVNDAERCDIPFYVGGIPHSRDPVFYVGLETANLEGEIDELRISKVMRYPVADKLAIIRQKLPEAGLNLPYKVVLGTDAAVGRVSWEMVEGSLPKGLALDTEDGVIRGTPEEAVADSKLTIRARDEAGATDEHIFSLTVVRGRLVTESLPPAFVGAAYRGALTTEHMAEPLEWEVVSGALPEGMTFDTEAGRFAGTAVEAGWSRLSVQVTDANGLQDQVDLTLKVLPAALRVIGLDRHTVVLYDWQGPNGKLIPDVRSYDDELLLTFTNTGGDRGVSWPGREGRFPQEPGHGEQGYVVIGNKENEPFLRAKAKFEAPPKLDLKTCAKEWTVEAWVRRGGPYQAFGDVPFDYGHICGTYDNTKRGVWELYLSDHDSPDGSMAPGVHFQSADYTWKDLHPWTRPEGIVADENKVGINDTEWHHVAWQYSYAEDRHQLFLDGTLIWQMQSPDGRKLVNNREHKAQFSVFTRLGGYTKYGGAFNYLEFGNFFGQIGEIRISDARRY